MVMGITTPYTLLMTFYAVWKQNFPHIKMSHAVEDICKQCNCLANNHKLLENNGINSLADDSLIVQKSEPDET